MNVARPCFVRERERERERERKGERGREGESRMPDDAVKVSAHLAVLAPLCGYFGINVHEDDEIRSRQASLLVYTPENKRQSCQQAH